MARRSRSAEITAGSYVEVDADSGQGGAVLASYKKPRKAVFRDAIPDAPFAGRRTCPPYNVHVMTWGEVELEPEVDEWLDSLSQDDQETGVFYVDLLAERGCAARRAVHQAVAREAPGTPFPSLSRGCAHHLLDRFG
ncbi:hypothetical protein Misp02_61860 [Microtetraspora sp. NBRC 16547]|nr:hypothetical protein Misp02_61860 [Microtetraspora sp. NBRC 16547]